MGQRSLHVLVVDDTVVYRRVLQNVVAEIPWAEVVGIAANGRIALDKLEQIDVDFVLLDVEMPELDGIETLREIRQRWPGIGVVLLSGGDRRAADMTMRALELGALDFVAKADTGDVQRNHRQLVGQLTAIMRAFEVARSLSGGERNVGRLGVSASAPAASTVDRMQRLREIASPSKSDPSGLAKLERRGSAPGEFSLHARSSAGWTISPAVAGPVASGREFGRSPIEVVLIGCSTGGPQALARIIPQLPGDLGVPVLVVQHMPPVFTSSLAESLNRESKLRVSEAVDNQLIVPNTVLIAPGGRHMGVKAEKGRGDRRVALNDDPLVNSVRPAADVLFLSAASVYGGATLSLVLTGMGEDGLDGVRSLRACGGQTLTQNAASCVVYGMPRAIEKAGLSDESVPLDDLASRLSLLVRQYSIGRGGSAKTGAV